MKKSVLLCFFCVLTACSNAGQTVSKPPLPGNPSQPGILVSLEREFGECLGKCPVYKISLYEDGSVEFLGIENVRQEGLVRQQIPAESVQRLKALFEAVRFSLMRDEYIRGKNCSTPVLSDADTVILMYVERGKPKRVKHYQGCMRTTKSISSGPDDLDSLFRLEKAIVKETNIERFISNE